MSITNSTRALALTVVAVLLMGCGELRGERLVSGLGTETVASQSQPAPPPRSPAGAIEVDDVTEGEAFGFSATELVSRRGVSGADLVAGGPVVITFVVPQCPICVAEGPELAASAVSNSDVTYVFVHSGGTAEAYDNYVRSSGLTTDNVVHLDDSPGLLWGRFGITQQPTSVLIDGDGRVSQAFGALGEERLEQVISELRS